jgi:hypothetical protein
MEAEFLSQPRCKLRYCFTAGGGCRRRLLLAPVSDGGQCMARTAKKSELGREPFRRLSDSEILLFVTRTLQPQLDDADASNVFAKLQSLKDTLRQQEMTLLDWPDCAGKDRMRDALAVASRLIAQIVDELARRGQAGRRRLRSEIRMTRQR